MWIEAFQTDGITHAPSFDGDAGANDLPNDVSFGALLFSVGLLKLAMNPQGLPQLPQALVPLMGRAEQGGLAGCRADEVRARVNGQKVGIVVRFRLDPPLLGVLRSHVLRHPTAALGLPSGTFTVGVTGWFASGLQECDLQLHQVLVGDAPLDVSGDWPPWLAGFLRGLSDRIAVSTGQLVNEEALSLLLSSDPELRTRALGVHKALADAGLPSVQPALVGGELRLRWGAGLAPVQYLGPMASTVLSLAVLVEGGRPDVLLADEVPDGCRDWLAGRCRGDTAVLEQVIWRARG